MPWIKRGVGGGSVPVSLESGMSHAGRIEQWIVLLST